MPSVALAFTAKSADGGNLRCSSSSASIASELMPVVFRGWGATPAEKVWGTMFALVLSALVHHTPQPSIREGAVPPSFSQLREIHGKPVVINFWATWCKPCTDELKYFTQAESAYGSRIAIITISTEPHDVAASYFRLWNIDLPVIEDL